MLHLVRKINRIFQLHPKKKDFNYLLLTFGIHHILLNHHFLFFICQFNFAQSHFLSNYLYLMDLILMYFQNYFNFMNMTF